jgi:uncharacterized protein
MEAAVSVPHRSRRSLAIEFGVLFGVLPLLAMAADGRIPLLVMLGSAATVCMVMLLGDPAFDRRGLWNAGPAMPGHPARELWRVLGTFVVAGGALTALVAWARPEILFYFPRARPELYALVMLAYPVLSVIAQNVIYRAFIFHRYRDLFTDPRDMIIASALAFGFAHVIFQNVLAVLLTAVGGLLFARTYARTRSLVLASIEHTLYGWLIITIGLGWYVYLGAVR